MSAGGTRSRLDGGAVAWRDVPWWGTLSAAAAPVLLVGGMAAAGALQPPGFAAFSGTVSSLAGQGANYTWVMTLTFAVVGALEVVTALALRPAAAAGRFVLGGAGLAGLLVAAFPEHLGGSRVHALWAGIGFAGLIAWPLFAMRRHRGEAAGPGAGCADAPRIPWALRPASCIRVTAALSVLTLWFAAEQASRGSAMGLAERVAGLAQTLWPTLVVVSCHRAQAGEEGLSGELAGDLPDAPPGGA